MLFHEYLLASTPKNKVILKTIDQEFKCQDILALSIRVSEAFRAAGIKRHDRLILLMENGLDALVAQLSCSRLGAVFIPVSPREPVVRINKIIEQVQPAMCICSHDVCQEFEASVPICILVNGRTEFREERGVLRHNDVHVDERDLLYIISTSGTTGEPKGIAMSHKATVEFFKAIVAHCNLSETDNVGTIAPLQFDLSILDLGLALGSKACLTILPQAFAYQPKKLVKLIKEKNITQFDSVPSIWTIIINYDPDLLTQLSSLKSLLYAGERFPLKNIRLIQKILPNLKITNCFGQSESIACSFYDLENPLSEKMNEISLGQGFPGNTFYLVNEDDGLIQESYTVGELWLSNQSLFDGYWKNPGYTNARLIVDPFNKKNNHKVFKSGDLVYRDVNNNFFFVGRKDNQVKIKGNRVELDEISQCLNNHEKISGAVLVPQVKGTETYLLAFVSLKDGNSIGEDEIRRYCRLNLPQYMVPEEIKIKDRLPLTVNGKVNTKLLMEEYQGDFGSKM